MRTKILAIILVGMFLLTSFTTVTASSTLLNKSEILQTIKDNRNAYYFEETEKEEFSKIKDKISNFIDFIDEIKDNTIIKNPVMDTKSDVRRASELLNIFNKVKVNIKDKINAIKLDDKPQQKIIIITLMILYLLIDTIISYIYNILTGLWVPGMIFFLFLGSIGSLIAIIILYLSVIFGL